MVGFVLFLLAANPARAATTIGDANNAGSNCDPNLTIHQGVSAPGSPSYVVPAGGGVIASWRYQAGALADQIKFLVIRQVAPNQFRVVQSSPVQTMTPNTVNSFPVRIPAQAGDLIAIHTVSNNATCANITTAAPADQVDGCNLCDPPDGSPYTTMTVSAGARVNVAASLEPDADSDGFGDETQDQCATDPSTQAACPTPTISGVARANSRLTGNPGGQPINPTFQWLRCDAAGNNCSPIGGATGTTYTPGGPDVGHTLRFRKTATNSSGSQTTESAATSQIARDPRRCSTPFTGTNGNDTIAGTTGGDSIFGLRGNDRLNGRAGRDCLQGAGGRDQLSGGSAGDRLSGGSGRDRLNGGSGDDRASGGSGNDRVSGSGGKDRISGGGGNDRISGGAGADRISDGGGRNTVSGGSGNDIINVRNGKKDVVDCGTGRRDAVRVDANDAVIRCETIR